MARLGNIWHLTCALGWRLCADGAELSLCVGLVLVIGHLDIGLGETRGTLALARLVLLVHSL